MQHLQHYAVLMRLDKPIGIWLVFFPAAWGALLAPVTPSVTLLVILLLGAAVTRAGGCILNDLADRELDREVERTRHRPLAAGKVSVNEACGLLLLLGLIALTLTLLLPRQVFYVAIPAIPMIAAYPWMKRLTWWPQLFLGLTFNLGALLGWLATGAPFGMAVLFLYAACICWTLAYDTIYAVQDMADDARIGIKSSARRLGAHLPRFVGAMFLCMQAFLFLAGWLADCGPLYLLGLIAVGIHMRWQLSHLPSTAPVAGILFRSNALLGLLLLVFLAGDRLLGA